MYNHLFLKLVEIFQNPMFSHNGDCRYLFCCSYSHNVAPKGKYIAFVSAEAETDNPETELKPGIDLLGPVDETFFDIYDRYEPINKPEEDNCFISTVCLTKYLYRIKFMRNTSTIVFFFFLVCRVMIQPPISSQQSKMCSQCTGRSLER